MKKLAVGLLGAALVLGAGTAVFAAGNSGDGSGISFEKMLPFMEKMHPDASKEELQDMYKACHENGGIMQGTDRMSSMMNNF